MNNISYFITNFIENIIFSTEFISFIFGALFTEISKFVHKKYKIYQFTKMIDKFYIQPFLKIPDNELSNLPKKLDIFDSKLRYLKDNELCYYTSNGQFEIIRIIEYTLSCFKRCKDYMTDHPFIDLTDPPEKIIKIDKDNYNRCKKCLRKWNVEVKKYYKLQIDYLQ